jgi:hypothetical protein
VKTISLARFEKQIFFFYSEKRPSFLEKKPLKPGGV